MVNESRCLEFGMFGIARQAILKFFGVNVTQSLKDATRGRETNLEKNSTAKKNS